MKREKRQEVWGILVMRYGHPYATHHGQVRAVVMAKSRAEAARLLDVSDRHLKNYGSTTGNQKEIAAAASAPGKVFFAPQIEKDGPIVPEREGVMECSEEEPMAAKRKAKFKVGNVVAWDAGGRYYRILKVHPPSEDRRTHGGYMYEVKQDGLKYKLFEDSLRYQTARERGPEPRKR